ncbi:unnamed protein product [Urochloa humidicola]
MDGGKKVAVVLMLVLLSTTASFHGAAARLQGVRVGVENGEHGRRGRVAVAEAMPTAISEMAGHSGCTSDPGNGKGPCTPTAVSEAAGHSGCTSDPGNGNGPCTRN